MRIRITDNYSYSLLKVPFKKKKSRNHHHLGEGPYKHKFEGWSLLL